jgi:Ca2+-binding RTX toxin-like protein
MIALSIPQIGTITPLSSASFSSVTDIRAPFDLVSDPPIINPHHLSGSPIDTYVEAVSSLESHPIDRLSDSLAVINFMYTLDISITIEKANVILLQSANQMNLSLEGLMSHFAELFNASPVTVTDSNHDSIYEVIGQITSAVGFMPNQFVIEPVDSDVVSLAQGGDKAALYTLINAQPFVIRGLDQATTDSLYSATGGDLNVSNYTEQYLQDRAQYLSNLLHYNTIDADVDYETIVPNIQDLAFYSDPQTTSLVTFTSDSGEPIVIDETLKTILGDDDAYRYTLFDNDDSKSLEGNKNEDHLYGAGGDDTLDGGAGNDYLEGGVGNDTYRFDYGDGLDRIVDNGAADEKNKLFITHEDGGTASQVSRLALLAGSSVYQEVDAAGVDGFFSKSAA